MNFFGILRPLGQLWRGRSLGLLLLLSLLLSGCVEYDLGVQFNSPHRGELVQRLQISDRLRSFSETTVQQWIKTLEQRSRSLGGRVRRTADHDLLVTIPFSSSADLETKFNQFFSPTQPARSVLSTTELPEIESQLQVSHANLLLLERDRLRWDVDLRSLGVTSSGNSLISPTALLDLKFRLKTPWGARVITKGLNADPDSGQTLTWQLIPGELNHLEAVFWLPSPLGIGTVMIGLLVAAGASLKSSRSLSPAAIDSPLPASDLPASDLPASDNPETTS